MGATSVTGVGVGDAFPGVKGPGNGRDIYVSMLTPHVLHCGTVALVGGTKTVTFPEALTGSETNYVVFLSPESANNAWVSAKTDSSGNFVSFAITGTGTDHVMWMVVSAAINAT